MTAKNRGGRPRINPPKSTPFGEWIKESGLAPMEIKDALGCGLSTVYALANGEFTPGRDLGWAIAELTDGAVPFTPESWPGVK